MKIIAFVVYQSKRAKTERSFIYRSLRNATYGTNMTKLMSNLHHLYITVCSIQFYSCPKGPKEYYFVLCKSLH